MSQDSWVQVINTIEKPACLVNRNGVVLASNASFKKFVTPTQVEQILTSYSKQTDKIGFIQFKSEEAHSFNASITESSEGYLMIFYMLNSQIQHFLKDYYQKLFIEFFPGGSITLIDKNFTILYTAGLGYSKYNIDPAIFYNKPFSKLVENDVYSFLEDHLEEISNGETCHYESLYKDTAYSTTFKPLLNDNDELEKILIVVNDISDLHNYQLKLYSAKENLDQYRQILEGSINEIYLFDSATLRFTVLNKSAEKNLGYSKEEWTQLTPVDIKPLFDEKTFKKLLVPLFDGSKSQLVFETIHQRKDGSTYDVEVRLQLMDNKNQSYFYAIILDISDRKKYTEELRAAKLEAEEASQAKSEFLATMSHEIRTPLNAIVGYADLLKDLSLSNDAQNYVQTIHNSSRALMGIINDILDYAKIEAGKLTLVPETVSLKKILEEAMDQIAILAEKKGLDRHISLDESIPEFIEIDPVRIRQILVNLLSNAVKFTNSGSVCLGVNYVRDGIGSSSIKELEFYVQDTGVGIKSENQSRIFEAFTQEYNFTQKVYGGTGLGLNICNHLLALMNSKLQVNSEVDQGTRFYFNLEVDTKDVYKTEDLQLYWKTALIIDDDKDSQQLLKSYLHQLGIKAQTSESALNAISFFKYQRYDLVFVDHNMPYLSGIEFIRFLKDSISDKLDNQRIILLNSSLNEDEVNTIVKSLPVHGVIHKPFTKWRIEQLLKNLSLNAKVLKEPLPSIKKPLSYQKVLIVEDQEVNIVLLKTMLHKFKDNLEIDAAINGKEAVQLVKSNTYNLILMDIQMPVMNGYDASRIIRNELKFTNPIIALTANVVKGEYERCIEAGMDDYLFKPLTKDKLNSMLKKWEPKQSEHLLDDDRQNKDHTFGINENLAHFDKQALLEKVGGDFQAVELMMEMAGKYFEEVPTLLENSKSRPEELHNHAHKLKGTALNMEFTILARLALRLMKDVDDGIPYFDLIKDIQDEITIVKKMVNW